MQIILITKDKTKHKTAPGFQIDKIIVEKIKIMIQMSTLKIQNVTGGHVNNKSRPSSDSYQDETQTQLGSCVHYFSDFLINILQHKIIAFHGSFGDL
jgi:hypothetical protein